MVVIKNRCKTLEMPHVRLQYYYKKVRQWKTKLDSKNQ